MTTRLKGKFKERELLCEISPGYPYYANRNAAVCEEIGQMFEIRELQCAVAYIYICLPTEVR
jgi:hypothetical protein